MQSKSVEPANACSEHAHFIVDMIVPSLVPHMHHIHWIYLHGLHLPPSISYHNTTLLLLHYIVNGKTYPQLAPTERDSVTIFKSSSLLLQTSWRKLGYVMISAKTSIAKRHLHNDNGEFKVKVKQRSKTVSSPECK